MGISDKNTKSHPIKVLFVCSGKHNNQPSSIISSQANSLIKKGLHVDYFIIKKRKLMGYLQAGVLLSNYLRKTKYDVVHAHYSLSGILSELAGAKPLVISLMGSDILGYGWQRIACRFFSRRWDVTIVKSHQMQKLLKGRNVKVIPNGVDLSRFRLIVNEGMKDIIPGTDKQLIIFIGAPSRKEKNFYLAKEAINILKHPNVLFLTLNNLPSKLIPYYMNAASLLVLPSLWEGSPNVVKEAMACNCPVVATDVGDVRWLFGDEPGYFIADFTPEDFAAKIKMALEFSKKHRRTNGRKRIIKLGLDSESVALKIINIYHEILKR